MNGINLLGVGSAETPMATRLTIWEKLSTDWNIKDKLSAIAKEVTLDELNTTYFDNILQGKLMGRIVVNLNNL